MDRIGTTFKGELTSKEQRNFKRNGNIQSHNGRVCNSFNDMLQYSAGSAECNDDFYRELYNTVKKCRPDRSKILLSIIFDAAAMAFILVIASLDLSRGQTLVFSGVPVFVFCDTTYRVIREFVIVSRVLKCVDRREDVTSVSLTIDGACSFTDNSGDVSEVFRYIYSEPMLIAVPQEIYDPAEIGGRLIGAVVGTGKKKLFYAMYVI